MPVPLPNYALWCESTAAGSCKYPTLATIPPVNLPQSSLYVHYTCYRIYASLVAHRATSRHMHVGSATFCQGFQVPQSDRQQENLQGHIECNQMRATHA